MANNALTLRITAQTDKFVKKIQDAQTKVKRLSELEKQRAEYAQSLQSADDSEARNHILDEADRLRLSIIEVLKSEKTPRKNSAMLFFSSFTLWSFILIAES